MITNHVAPGLFPAGFIGVDIFFVLSGFLITRIIYRSAISSSFSYLDFYWRRCRRIFPALILVLCFTWLIGALCLTGPEFERLGKHIFAASIFSSNALLWSEVGYFDLDAVTKPLLHLWSLGVEEQFYLAWPFLISTLARRSDRWLEIAIGALALFSFGLCYFTLSFDKSAAFYLPHSRFWELAVGGWLALCEVRTLRGTRLISAIHDRLGPDALGWIGGLLLLIGFTLIRMSSVYPSVWTLLPVAGTASLIAAGPRSRVNSWLGVNDEEVVHRG